MVLSDCCSWVRNGHKRLLPICDAFFIQRGHRRSLPILRKKFFLIGEESDDGHRIKRALYIGIKRLWEWMGEKYHIDEYIFLTGISRQNKMIKYFSVMKLCNPYLLLIILIVLCNIWTPSSLLPHGRCMVIFKLNLHMYQHLGKSCEYQQANAKVSHWRQLNTGSGNGSSTEGTKPLPEWTNFDLVPWRNMASKGADELKWMWFLYTFLD